MRKSLTIVLLFSLISHTAFSQSATDSLINTLNTDTIQGKVPTYYSPGNNEIATDLQKTITNAINFYERIQSNKFHIKLAVLDSVQWPSVWVPYGFVFYSDGWIFMNTGMNYENFKNVYGLEQIYGHLDSELKNDKKSPFCTHNYPVFIRFSCSLLLLQANKCSCEQGNQCHPLQHSHNY